MKTINIMNSNFLNHDWAKLINLLNQVNKGHQEMQKTMRDLKRMQKEAEMRDILKGWVFLDKVRDVLGVSNTTIYRYINEGILPVSKFGTRLIFNEKDIEDIIRGNYKRIDPKNDP